MEIEELTEFTSYNINLPGRGKVDNFECTKGVDVDDDTVVNPSLDHQLHALLRAQGSPCNWGVSKFQF